MKWLWIGLGSVVFWFCAYWGLLIVAMGHGDCWATMNHAEIAPCYAEKQIVVIVYMVIAVVLYSFLMWRAARSRR